MGNETPDPNKREGCICSFNEAGCWTIPQDWSFDGDIAVFGPRSGIGDTQLICPLQMTVGQSYRIQFEIFEANFYNGDSFSIEISSGIGGFSTGYTANGKYDIFLKHLEAGYPIKLTAECIWNDPTSFKVKGFICELTASTAAYGDGLFPMSDSKNEVSSPDQSEASVLLAHWRDKTNCLIKYKP